MSVSSCSAQSSPRVSLHLPEHIVVLVHGHNGAPTDFDTVEKTLRRKYTAEEMLIIKSERNHTQTALGVEVGGAKLASEIVDAILHYDLAPGIDSYKLSIIAHSLGGLYARYAIPTVMGELSILNIEYVSFITMCTPHLGSRRPRATSTFKNILRMGVHKVLESKKIYGQTGIDLLVTNDPEDEAISEVKLPVIEAMSMPDSTYVQALQRFQYCTLIAIVDGDMVVPFPSGSIRNFNPYESNTMSRHYADWRWHRLNDCVDPTMELVDPFKGLDASCSERFESVEQFDCDNKRDVEFTYELLLNQQSAVNWRRIDIIIEAGGVKGKLRLHDWPINKMQPAGCLAPEFIDVLGDLVGNDHGLGLRDSALSPPPSDDDAESSRASSDGATPSSVAVPTSPSRGSFLNWNEKVQETQGHISTFVRQWRRRLSSTSADSMPATGMASTTTTSSEASSEDTPSAAALQQPVV